MKNSGSRNSRISSGAPDDERHGHDRQEQPGQGHDPVGVRLPTVRVVLHRPHQLRHQHGVHHAARQQDVEHVRDGVGDVEHVGVQSDAECRGEQDAAHEAAQPGDHRPGSHHRGRGEQRSRVGSGVGRRGRSARGRVRWAPDGAWGVPSAGPSGGWVTRPRPYATGGRGGAARSGARSSPTSRVPPAARMYQISRPTWLVRRLNVSGVPVVSPAVVTGKIVTSWTPTPLLTWSRIVVRCPGCMLTGSGVATLTVGLSARARSPTVIGCSSPLTRVTVSEPEPPESVTKSDPGHLDLLHLRSRGGVELEDQVGGEPRRRPGAEGRRLQRGPGQPLGHAVVVGEQAAEHPARVRQGAGRVDVRAAELLGPLLGPVDELSVVRRDRVARGQGCDPQPRGLQAAEEVGLAPVRPGVPGGRDVEHDRAGWLVALGRLQRGLRQDPLAQRERVPGSDGSRATGRPRARRSSASCWPDGRLDSTGVCNRPRSVRSINESRGISVRRSGSK